MLYKFNKYVDDASPLGKILHQSPNSDSVWFEVHRLWVISLNVTKGLHRFTEQCCFTLLLSSDVLQPQHLTGAFSFHLKLIGSLCEFFLPSSKVLSCTFLKRRGGGKKSYLLFFLV